MFISIFMIQIMHNIINCWIFSDIEKNCLLGNRKKIAKFLMRTFTCHSTFLYGNSIYRAVLRIRIWIQIQIHRIHMFLALLNPYPDLALYGWRKIRYWRRKTKFWWRLTQSLPLSHRVIFKALTWLADKNFWQDKYRGRGGLPGFFFNMAKIYLS